MKLGIRTLNAKAERLPQSSPPRVAQMLVVALDFGITDRPRDVLDGRWARRGDGGRID